MKGIKDEHYEEYATNPEYCGYLLRRKAFGILIGGVTIGNLILIFSWLCR